MNEKKYKIIIWILIMVIVIGAVFSIWQIFNWRNAVGILQEMIFNMAKGYPIQNDLSNFYEQKDLFNFSL